MLYFPPQHKTVTKLAQLMRIKTQKQGCRF